VSNTKLIAFGVSSFIAGIAGGLYGYNFGGVSADRFSALTALSVIAFAYIGGITMVSGALVAGFLATQGLSQYAFQKWFGISGDWTVLFAGIALVFNLVFYPEGIAGASYAKKAKYELSYFIRAAIIAPPAPYVPPGFPTTLMSTDYGHEMSASDINNVIAFLIQGQQTK